MIEFLWHGAECCFWCFVWHKLSHRAPKLKAKTIYNLYTESVNKGKEVYPPSPTGGHAAFDLMFRKGRMRL